MTSMYPLPPRARDERFDDGLIHEVAVVLELRGFPPVRVGSDKARLRQFLAAFLYDSGGAASPGGAVQGVALPARSTPVEGVRGPGTKSDDWYGPPVAMGVGRLLLSEAGDVAMSLDLEAIKARADAAEPGPWTLETNGYGSFWINTPASRHVWGLHGYPDEAAFVAAAREDIPALVAEVERLNRLIDAVHDELLQGGQNHEYRWRQAVMLLEPRRLARRTGGAS